MKTLEDNFIDVIKNNSFIDLRRALEELTSKKSVYFSFSPVPHYRIKAGEKTYIICNKKYADNPDYIIDNIALGTEGKI